MTDQPIQPDHARRALGHLGAELYRRHHRAELLGEPYRLPEPPEWLALWETALEETRQPHPSERDPERIAERIAERRAAAGKPPDPSGSRCIASLPGTVDRCELQAGHDGPHEVDGKRFELAADA